jgi:hypothetical protein
MSIAERSEILSSLHKVNADLGVIFALCERTRAVGVGVSVQIARNNVLEAISEFQPDVPAPSTVLEFPRQKF